LQPTAQGVDSWFYKHYLQDPTHFYLSVYTTPILKDYFRVTVARQVSAMEMKARNTDKFECVMHFSSCLKVLAIIIPTQFQVATFSNGTDCGAITKPILFSHVASYS